MRVLAIDPGNTESAYILRKIKGKLYHQAELADLKANAVYIVSLAKVEKLGKEDK
jgi:hypothetical protein